MIIIRRKDLRNFILLIVSAFCISSLGAGGFNPGEPLAVYAKEGKWHFINHTGEEMFPPKEVVEFGGYGEGLFRLQMNFNGKNRWVFLDTLGEIKIIPEGDQVMMYSDGMALSGLKTADTVYDYLFGFIDKTGRIVIPHKFIDASYFVNGIAWARTLDTMGYIDKTGKFVMTFDGLVGNAFCEGMAVVNNFKYKMGYIDSTGKVAIPVQYDEVTPFREGKAFFHDDGWGGYMDKTGKIIISPRFEDGKPFSENYAFGGSFWMDKMILWAVIDTTGKLVTKFKFEAVRNFSEGIAAVAKDRSWGFINYQGEYVIPSQYSSAGSFKNGMAWASVPFKKYGFIDKNGNFLFEIPKPEKVFDIRFDEQVF